MNGTTPVATMRDIAARLRKIIFRQLTQDERTLRAATPDGRA